MSARAIPIIQRLVSGARFDPSGCLVWQRAKTRDGYALIRMKHGNTTRKGKRQATCAPSVLDEAADAIDALLAAQRVPVWPMPSAMPPFERAVGKQAMGDE